MYTIIIAGIIGIIIALYNFFKDGYLSWTDIDDWFMGLISIIAGAFFGCIAGVVIAISLPKHYITEKWDVKLVSLQDNNGVSGNFFLGSGQINNRMEYVFYYEYGDSTYKLAQEDYNNCTVKYNDSVHVCTTTYHHADNSLQSKFAIDLTGDWATYLFVVPKGTIKNNYQLDAQ